MRFAYADPPYFGKAAIHYAAHHPDAADWDNKQTHLDLIARLCDEYPDGWALSLNSTPGGRDSGTVCKYRDHWKHPHHWRVQVSPLQHFRRWALTRCEWCGGRSRKGDAVNHSMQWDAEPGPWWRGERGLFHDGCTSIHLAHAACLCEDGIYDSELAGWGYGNCARCGKRREWRSEDRRNSPVDDARRLLATIPAGERDAEKTAEVRRMWDAHRGAEQHTTQEDK